MGLWQLHVYIESFLIKKCVGEFYTMANYFIPIQAHGIIRSHHTVIRGRHDRDRMVVGSTTTYATSVYRH